MTPDEFMAIMITSLIAGMGMDFRVVKNRDGVAIIVRVADGEYFKITISGILQN